MRLRLLMPKSVLLDRDVTKITAEAVDGEFCILPRHIDFVTALVPGIMSFIADGEETFVAVDGGVLVKKGDDVMISSPRAVVGPKLGELQNTVLSEFIKIDDSERRARSAMAKLEADIVRKFMEMD